MHAHDFNLVRSEFSFQSFRRTPAKPVVATERIAIRDNENSTHDFDIDRFYVAPDALVRGCAQRNEKHRNLGDYVAPSAAPSARSGQAASGPTSSAHDFVEHFAIRAD